MTFKATIREITDPAEFAPSARVIRNAFRTVAQEFGLTRENAPTHPTFLTVRDLKQLKKRPVKFFGLFLGIKQVGFIAVEKTDDSKLFYIEKLAVLPEHRHGGYGRNLVGFAIDYIRENGGKQVALGMLLESDVLKNWYTSLGFKEISTHKFPGMPFTICFMQRDASPLVTEKSSNSKAQSSNQ